MITTVKNTRGYQISILTLTVSLLCSALIAWLGLETELRGRWFVRIGFATSVTTFLHQILLITKRRAYTRLHITHLLTVIGCIFSLLLCIGVPLLITQEYAALDEAMKTRTFHIFMAYGTNMVPLLIMFLSIGYSNSQMVQNLLHPYTEIIDGFTKSSGSVQMTNIPSSSVLKQVVIDGEGKDQSSNEFSNDSTAKNLKKNKVSSYAEAAGALEDEEELPASHKADGSSPKPSKVLKTWPKADPFPVRALYSFKPTSTSELPFKKGDTIIVLDCRGRWWQAQKEDRIGFIPSNYVSVLKKARVISNFTAVEDDQVSVKKDEIIEVMEKYEEKSLVRNVEDKIGAVPTDKLEIIEEN